MLEMDDESFAIVKYLIDTDCSDNKLDFICFFSRENYSDVKFKRKA